MHSMSRRGLRRLFIAATPLLLAPLGATAQPAGPDPLALADHLKQVNVLYYGSWRCPACQFQTGLFGEVGAQRLPYVECAKPEELPQQAAACQAAEIRAYPTWILPNGERRVGVQSLEDLQVWSGMTTGRP
ncbi:hypothetical protein [Synechococcus sp. BS55D]|uniref:hypothetical protein n=1 Tax=Synechococcus sp. BS55D TaxID=2055943 RepID=UPI001F1C4B88|nr:hypothetical protein [Synechococcus sp. BS55D]